MKKYDKKIIYYSDELNDDFAGVEKPKFKLPKNFKFTHSNIFWRMTAFFVYRIIMTPFAYIYCKLRFRLKTVDNTKIKPDKKQGCFLYCNHTLLAGDAFIPSVIMFPKKVKVIVSTDNIATRLTRNFILMSGAIPIPSSLKQFKPFLSAVQGEIAKGNCITVFPEAHIWPYYIKIRPFTKKSFNFPVKASSPVYISTTTFQKRKIGNTPKITVYLDGPFYPDDGLSLHKAEENLRNKVYRTMYSNSKNSTYTPIIYKRKEV